MLDTILRCDVSGAAVWSTRFWKVLDFGKEMQVLKDLFGRNPLVNILFGCRLMDGKNLVVILQNQ